MADSLDLAHENGRFPGPSSRKWQIPSTKLTKAPIYRFVRSSRIWQILRTWLTKMADSLDLAHENGRFPRPSSQNRSRDLWVTEPVLWQADQIDRCFCDDNISSLLQILDHWLHLSGGLVSAWNKSHRLPLFISHFAWLGVGQTDLQLDDGLAWDYWREKKRMECLFPETNAISQL